MDKKIQRLLTCLAMLALLLVPLRASGAETAGQVMRRASALLDRATGVSADFSLTSGGRTVKGSLKSSAAGFAIVTNGYSAWYDGRNLWTYNPSTVETTLVNPTAAELREVNPIMMVAGYEKDFTASYSKTPAAGCYGVVLTPKNAKTGLKSVVVQLDKRTYIPKTITVNPRSGASTVVAISSLRTDSRFQKSDFTYPSKKYPKAELIDLR